MPKKNDFGVTARLTDPIEGLRHPQGSELFLSLEGYLDLNCAPWDFGIRRKDFQKFALDTKMNISEVSSVEAVFGPIPKKRFGLTATTFESEDLSVTIVGLGDGQFQATTLCRGKNPMQLHIDTWLLLIMSAWEAPMV